MMRFATAVFASLLWLGAASAHAELLLRDAWVSKPLTPGAHSVAAFVTLINSGKEPVKIVGASSPFADIVGLHRISHHNGIVRMGPVPNISVPAGSELQLNADGLHLMLTKLSPEFRGAAQVTIELELESGEKIEQEFEVRALQSHAH